MKRSRFTDEQIIGTLKERERNEWPTAFMIDGGFWRSVRTSALPASA